MELEDILDNMRRDHRDAERWRKLMRLCGHLANSSETTVKLYQDDATHTRFIQVGKEHHFAYVHCSFEDTIDSIPEPKE